MTHGKEVQEALRPLARDLRRMIPDVYTGFASLHEAALAPGALDTKTKELIAFAKGKPGFFAHDDGALCGGQGQGRAARQTCHNLFRLRQSRARRAPGRNAPSLCGCGINRLTRQHHTRGA